MFVKKVLASRFPLGAWKGYQARLRTETGASSGSVGISGPKFSGYTVDRDASYARRMTFNAIAVSSPFAVPFTAPLIAETCEHLQ